MIISALIARLKTVNSSVYLSVSKKHNRLPVITVELEGSFRNRHFSAGNIQTGLIESDFEISVWGKTSDEVVELSANIISSLENFSGPWVDGGSPQQVHSIADIEITGEDTGFDGATELNTYSIFITIAHTEG